MNKQELPVYINKNLHYKLKFKAIELNLTLKELVNNILEKELKSV